MALKLIQHRDFKNTCRADVRSCTKCSAGAKKSSSPLWVTTLLAIVWLSGSVFLQASFARADDLISASTAEIIRVAGYRADELFFTTSDGYRLLVVRASNPLINGGRAPAEGRQPVLFIHGILTSSKAFVVRVNSTIKPTDRSRLDVASTSLDELQEILGAAPASQSLVTTLLDLGHIVYLLNRRGEPGSLPPGDLDNAATKNNGYGAGSRSVVDKIEDLADRDSAFKRAIAKLTKKLTSDVGPIISQEREFTETLIKTIETLPTPSQLLRSLPADIDVKFWNYSLDEQARYDIPECIEFVLEDAGAEQVSLVGHSAGGGLILMALALNPALASKVTNSLLWAPALDAGHGHQSAVFAVQVYLLPMLEAYIGPIPPSTLVPIVKRLLADGCVTKVAQVTTCQLADRLLLGNDGGQQAVTPRFVSISLNSMSSHELAQFAQSFKDGRMHFYDYGNPVQNRLAYNQTEPPVYPIQRIISRKLTLWAGVTDTLVSPEDVQMDISGLTVPVYYKLIDETGYFNHDAFLSQEYIARLLIVPGLKILDTPTIPYNAGRL